MQDILSHLDMPILSWWTGAWVGRAGILAQMSSLPLLAPEILGPERLKGVEEALKRGLTSPSVQRGAIVAWIALVLLVVFPVAWLMPTLFPLPSSRWGFLGFSAVQGLAAFSNFVWIEVVSDQLMQHKVDSEVLFSTQGELARASRAVLNPLEFRRLVRPALWKWVFWAVGIPLHIVMFVCLFLLPKGVLGLIHLEQRLLAGGIGLRSLVFGTGAVLLVGGLFAQFLATFGHQP